MFIDDKVVLFLFVMLIIQSRGGMQSSGVTESDVKKDVIKQLTNAAKQKDGEEN